MGEVREEENKEAIVGELEMGIKAETRVSQIHHTPRNRRSQKIALTCNHTDIMLRNFPAPPLLLLVALLISSMPPPSSSSPYNATRRAGVPNPRFSASLDDYDDLDREPTEAPRKPTGSPLPHCKYEPCEDQQESCPKLALNMSCSCPGISGPFEKPDAPTLYTLSLESKGVVVRWCAPASTVTHYVILVGGQGEGRKAGENRRMMELEDLAPGTKVCVQAANTAGVSTQESRSCTTFDPSDSETRLAVTLALIGTAVAVVVLIVVGLLVWCCRRHRKTATRTANRGT